MLVIRLFKRTQFTLLELGRRVNFEEQKIYIQLISHCGSLVFNRFGSFSNKNCQS